MLPAAHNLELLTAHAVWCRPMIIIFFEDFAVLDNLAQLLENCTGHNTLFADHHNVSVIGIVGIAQPSVWAKFKLKELMAI